ncbi:cytochrome P450 4C1-like [Schistocerca serialis cubense]|uniref:cytochrome P450 4C1-like n=1 Tax=Schistocerca serialis cubense TaxID=2023355 RepID=UPI00214F208D|nr:cytochrome P450 4C1-like [Schistocerca serialis cubense]
MDVLVACCAVVGYALAGLLAFCAWLWMNRPRTDIPGPHPLPLLGNVLHFRKLPVLLEHFRELHRRYGDVFRFYAGPKLIVVVTRPEDAKRLLVGVKMRGRDAYAVTPLLPFTGNGLITSKGNIWKEHRRLIEPTFHSELMKDFMQQFNEGAEFVCKNLAAAAGTEYDITRMLIHATLAVVTASIFGTKMDEIEPDVNKQAEVADVFIEALKLMQARSLAIAGTETAATTLGNALVLLGLHPEWQEAVWKEVDDVFRRGGAYLRTSTENDLSKFRIMDAVLKETLRLYPAIPNPPVSTEEDIQLEGTGYVIPRDSLVLVSLILLHRRPDNFPDPDKFDPGRFLEGGSARSLPPGSYLPFGAGSRKCVGGRYAFLEMKTVLAAVLRRFRVFPGSSREELEQVELSVSGSPVTGFRIICIPRSDQPANSVPHAVNT